MGVVIKNITVGEYISLEGEAKTLQDTIMKFSPDFSKPVDVFGVGELRKKSFGLVKELQTAFCQSLTYQQLFEYITKLTGKTEAEILDIPLIHFCQFHTWILKELERISKLESKLLSTYTSGKMEAAGVDSFDQFGAFNQLYKLAKGDITKYNEIESLEYNICLTHLYYEKTTFEFNERYAKLK